MEGYIGEFDVDVQKTAYKDFTQVDWAMHFIEWYGWIDGAHHKTWVLDQVSRILKGTPIELKEARWKSGHRELRIRTGEPSHIYLDWVKEMKDGEDGPNTYNYDEGIAP